MSNLTDPAARRQPRWLRLLSTVGIVAAATTTSPAPADDDATIVRVEEDWRLVVSVPDADTNAPQISSVLAPTADVDAGYAEFDLNHHSQPAYRPGGMQLQVWSGDRPIVVNNDPDGGMFQSQNETVTWTQTMALDDGELTFGVVNGVSTTWGAFGGNQRLQIRVAAALSSLNGYDTAVSTANSGIGYASNRVQILQITAVRRYTSDGRVIEDKSSRNVFVHE